MNVKQSSNNVVTMAVIAGIICLLVYLRALSCGFVDSDDPDYVLNNPLIRSFEWNMVAEAFRQPHVGWWMPLTWISLAVDFHFWGLNPFGYHLTNIVLHSLNTGLVVMLADRVLQGKWSRIKEQGTYLYPATLLFAGLLWGIHPLRVESVAWVTERKDVLNGLFALSSVLAYLYYATRKESNTSVWFSYLISLALFTCSLMAKSVTVVLPLVLLVLDRYPLGRLRLDNLSALFVEKMPFFALSLLMTFVTIRFAGDTSYLVSNSMFPWHERLLVSGNAVLQYLRYMIWPAGITPYHIIPDPVPVLPYAAATLVVLSLSMLFLWFLRKKVWIGMTWLLFVIPLLPVLAFMQNGDQGFAARFTYLPSVSLSLMAAALVGMCVRNSKKSVAKLLPVAVILIVLFSSVVMSRRLIKVWDNGGTMWTRVINHAPTSSAYWQRASYYYLAGNYAGAVKDYTESIRLVTPVWRPHIHNLYAHRGEVLLAAGNYQEAVADLTTALDSFPNPLYFRLRGEALLKLGRLVEAGADLGRAGKELGPLGWYF